MRFYTFVGIACLVIPFLVVARAESPTSDTQLSPAQVLFFVGVNAGKIDEQYYMSADTFAQMTRPQWNTKSQQLAAQLNEVEAFARPLNCPPDVSESLYVLRNDLRLTRTGEYDSYSMMIYALTRFLRKLNQCIDTTFGDELRTFYRTGKQIGSLVYLLDVPEPNAFDKRILQELYVIDSEAVHLYSSSDMPQQAAQRLRALSEIRDKHFKDGKRHDSKIDENTRRLLILNLNELQQSFAQFNPSTS